MGHDVPRRKRKKVIVIDDSHARGLTTELSAHLGKVLR
jgi:predicted phosphoribosyltransferase